MRKLEQIIVKAQRGDLKAFGMLVRRFQNMAYGYACAILKDCHLAEDAVQEAFLDVYKHLAKLRATEAFAGWLRKIVFKHCDRLTRRKRVESIPLENVPNLVSSAQNPDEHAEKAELSKYVTQIIQDLPKNERVVTALFYMNEYSLKEIAAFLGIPISKVKNRLHAARRLLKEKMMQMVEEGFHMIQLPERFADVVVQMQFVIGKINPLRSRMKALSDAQLCDKHRELQQRMAAKEDRKGILAEGFALIREACRRSFSMEHYDIQLVASMMLDEGWVAEVAPGEGKGLICLPAAYLAVLNGKRVHVVKLTDGLSAQDAAIAQDVFSRLGITVGVLNGQDEAIKRRVYKCDVVYGSYTDFGFDYLHDLVKNKPKSQVQSSLDFAIIDEVDRVLIDACRTPLIIAQKGSENRAFYDIADQIARAVIQKQSEQGEETLYHKDPKHPASIVLTDAGNKEASLFAEVSQTNHTQIAESLRAHLILERDRDYVVQNGRVLILDAQSGRIQAGRQWSDGLHQAVEAKEKLDISPQALVERSLLVQDYFRQYKKLAGLTGTAAGEEFQARYNLNVGRVPTRQEVNRVDLEDRIFACADFRDAALVDEVCTYSQKMERPVLVCVESIADSEHLSQLFQAHHIRHQVLNARPERAIREERILSRAGWKGAVTIATQMVGRDAEIRLSDYARRAGGLHVVGYGRRVLRHHDDQLKYQAGKQGSPGSSRFFLCRTDGLVQAALEEMTQEQKREVLQKDETEAPWISQAIALAQQREAAKRLEIHKTLDKRKA